MIASTTTVTKQVLYPFTGDPPFTVTMSPLNFWDVHNSDMPIQDPRIPTNPELEVTHVVIYNPTFKNFSGIMECRECLANNHARLCIPAQDISIPPESSYKAISVLHNRPVTLQLNPEESLTDFFLSIIAEIPIAEEIETPTTFYPDKTHVITLKRIPRKASSKEECIIS